MAEVNSAESELSSGLHQWTSLQDAENPFSWPSQKKWCVTMTACFVTFVVGLNATSITSAALEINGEFGISDESFPNSFWPVTSWTFGAALAPMICLPLMEEHGIRLGYLTAYFLFTVFVIPQAVAHNFATLIVTRFFAGAAAGVLQDCMDGIIADMFDGPVARSLPVTCYVFFLLAGVTSGSVMGGAVVTHLDWRWMIYIQLIIYGITGVLVWVGFPETRGSVILRTREARTRSNNELHNHSPRLQTILKSSAIKEFVRHNVLRPFHMLFTEPVVFLFTLLTGLSYGVVFVSTVSVFQVYNTLYDWPEAATGLVQSSILVGECVGFLLCLYQNHVFSKSFESSKLAHNPRLPEVRLYLLIPGSFVGLSGGFFWYGWTSFEHLHWILPTIGLGLIGAGSMVTMTAIMMYLTDSYAKYAASASAAACFGENIFAAFLPLSAQTMYTKLGFQWASSLLGFIAFVLSFVPIILVWKGIDIRRKSRFMAEAAYS